MVHKSQLLTLCGVLFSLVVDVLVLVMFSLQYDATKSPFNLAFIALSAVFLVSLSAVFGVLLVRYWRQSSPKAVGKGIHRGLVSREQEQVYIA
ncbi:Transmembrane domain-containing protein [Spironucleus salmonicida]|uniref:Transmembrane domain-containing protein n=1 Tax=Spironucleus salmonicida TaxID=348837 RepID=V6LG32_9EUKA|nr:Transmembrane domain-containing protein [Spironucleus salmonicida]KAH0577482.1 Transmembrane domain-containing protein [Spironucleus salmonicida]|eukprot:EST43515.1 Transmembrane domain-containing protein [Spironucleus salmonicida]